MSSSNCPPQLHLTLPPNSTSFKRSFEEFGFDLESPVGSTGAEASGSNGNLSLSSTASGGNERYKRSRSDPSSSPSAGSFESSGQSEYETAGSSSSTSLSSNDVESDGVSALSATRPATLPTSDIGPVTGPSISPPRLPTPDIQDVEMPHYPSVDMEETRPLFSMAENVPSVTYSEQDENYRISLERFNAFDSQISALRRSRSHSPLERSPTPPPTLPPITVSTLSEDDSGETRQDSFLLPDAEPSPPLPYFYPAGVRPLHGSEPSTSSAIPPRSRSIPILATSPPSLQRDHQRQSPSSLRPPSGTDARSWNTLREPLLASTTMERNEALHGTTSTLSDRDIADARAHFRDRLISPLDPLRPVSPLFPTLNETLMSARVDPEAGSSALSRIQSLDDAEYQMERSRSAWNSANDPHESSLSHALDERHSRPAPSVLSARARAASARASFAALQERRRHIDRDDPFVAESADVRHDIELSRRSSIGFRTDGVGSVPRVVGSGYRRPSATGAEPTGSHLPSQSHVGFREYLPLSERDQDRGAHSMAEDILRPIRQVRAAVADSNVDSGQNVSSLESSRRSSITERPFLPRIDNLDIDLFPEDYGETWDRNTSSRSAIRPSDDFSQHSSPTESMERSSADRLLELSRAHRLQNRLHRLPRSSDGTAPSRWPSDDPEHPRSYYHARGGTSNPPVPENAAELRWRNARRSLQLLHDAPRPDRLASDDPLTSPLWTDWIYGNPDTNSTGQVGGAWPYQDVTASRSHATASVTPAANDPFPTPDSPEGFSFAEALGRTNRPTSSSTRTTRPLEVDHSPDPPGPRSFLTMHPSSDPQRSSRIPSRPPLSYAQRYRRGGEIPASNEMASRFATTGTSVERDAVTPTPRLRPLRRDSLAETPGLDDLPLSSPIDWNDMSVDRVPDRNRSPSPLRFFRPPPPSSGRTGPPTGGPRDGISTRDGHTPSYMDIDLTAYRPGLFRNSLQRSVESDRGLSRPMVHREPSSSSSRPLDPPYLPPLPFEYHEDRSAAFASSAEGDSFAYSGRSSDTSRRVEPDTSRMEPFLRALGWRFPISLPEHRGNPPSPVASGPSAAQSTEPSAVRSGFSLRPRSRGRRDMHNLFARQTRMEASRIEAEDTTPSASQAQGLSHAIDVLRADGLSSRRQQQLIDRFHHESSTERRRPVLWGDVHGDRDEDGLPPASVLNARRRRLFPGRSPFSAEQTVDNPTRAAPQTTTRGRSSSHSPVRDRPERFAPNRPEIPERYLATRAGMRARARVQREPSSSFLGGLPQLDLLNFRSAARRQARNFGDYMRDEDFDSSYENLLSIASTLGEARPRATPGHVIASLETGFYKDMATAESDQRCPICLDDYKPLDPVLKLSDCAHWFHKGCLEQWLHSASTCPVCRKRVTRRADDGEPGPSGSRRDDDDDRDRDINRFETMWATLSIPPPWR